MHSPNTRREARQRQKTLAFRQRGMRAFALLAAFSIIGGTAMATASVAAAEDAAANTTTSVATGAQVESAVAQGGNGDTHPYAKVFVCKYVGTPGVDERLQTGQNPISVSIHAIENNNWDGSVPGWFSDAHDRSYVLAYDTGQPEPDVSQCPQPDQPTPPEVVTGSGSFETLTCDLGARNWAELDAVPGGVWTFTDKNGGTYTAATGAAFSGTVPGGLSYGDIVVKLSDADDTDAYAVTPWSGTWTTVDPASLQCPEFVAGEASFTTATCDPYTDNSATLTAVPGGEWTFTDEYGETFVTAIGAGYNGGVPNGLGWGDIVVTLEDADDSDLFIVLPMGETWTTVNPESLHCNLDPEIVTGTATFETLSCTDGSKNHVVTDAVPGGVWTFTDKNGEVFNAWSGSYEGGIPEGLAYGEITVALSDADDTDIYEVTPWSGVWTTVDPGSLDCDTTPEPVVVTGTATFVTISCEAGTDNSVVTDAVNGGVWTFTDEDGNTFTTEVGEAYSGGIPEGLGYGEITVALSDADANDGYAVTPWSGTWVTLDPGPLDCGTGTEPVVVTGTATFEVLSCTEGSENGVVTDAVNGGVWTFTDQNGETFTTTVGAAYSGGIPEGLAFGDITVALSDADDADGYAVTPWSGTWSTVDPESLDCEGIIPPVVTGTATFETLSCTEGSTNGVVAGAVPGGIWTFTDEDGNTFSTATSEAYSGGIPDGLGYGNITVALSDADDADGIIVAHWSGVWSTVDPASLDCEVTEPPVVEPPVVEPPVVKPPIVAPKPTPVPSETDEDTVVPAGIGTGDNGDGDATNVGAVFAGMVLLLVGGGLLLRRRQHTL